MDRLFAVLKANPGLLVMTMLVISVGIVLTLVGAMMRAGGQSLRPITFMAVLFGIVIAPQFVWHSLVAAGIVEEAPTWVGKGKSPGGIDRTIGDPSDKLAAQVDPGVLATDGDTFRAPQRLFGADVDTRLMKDARTLLGDVFASAEVAQVAFWPSGETVTAAVFPSAKEARTALDRYVIGFGGTTPASSQQTVTFSRQTGQVARVAVADRALLVWTAPDPVMLSTRVEASEGVRFVEPAVAAAAADEAAASADGPRPFRVPLSWFIGWLTVNVVVFAFWFFKGAAWAAGVPAKAVPPTPPATVRERLLALNEQNLPWVVTPGATDDELEVNYRYADATWIDIFRAHKLRAAHRIVMRLDEGDRTVRVREYMSRFEASAGVGGASLDWRMSRGIQFFQFDYQKVLGARLDANGKPTGDLSYTYRFNLQEMKAPLIAAITESGWEWRPVILDAPPWLRWATE